MRLCDQVLDCHDLVLHEPLVCGASNPELLVSSGVDNFSIIDNDYGVGLADGAKPMSNNNCRASLSGAVNVGSNELLRFSIQSACGLIEDENERVFEHDTSKGYSLSLAARETTSAFSENGVQSLG
jgi:hypothetical protein